MWEAEYGASLPPGATISLRRDVGGMLAPYFDIRCFDIRLYFHYRISCKLSYVTLYRHPYSLHTCTARPLPLHPVFLKRRASRRRQLGRFLARQLAQAELLRGCEGGGVERGAGVCDV